MDPGKFPEGTKQAKNRTISVPFLQIFPDYVLGGFQLQLIATPTVQYSGCPPVIRTLAWSMDTGAVVPHCSNEER